MHACFVTGVVTALTLFSVLAVKRPPMITTQPESVTVFSIEDLVMNCEATGNPPPMLVSTHKHKQSEDAILVMEEQPTQWLSF